MTRTGKFFLALLSWLPLNWTVIILLASLFDGIHTEAFDSHPFKHGLKQLLIAMLHPGFLAVFLIVWVLLLAIFTLKKIATWKQCVIHVFILLAGIGFACLSLKYDLFGVSGSYID